jgi:hypothetical protein
MLGISSIVEELLASDEEICSVESVSTDIVFTGLHMKC